MFILFLIHLKDNEFFNSNVVFVCIAYEKWNYENNSTINGKEEVMHHYKVRAYVAL